MTRSQSLKVERWWSLIRPRTVNYLYLVSILQFSIEFPLTGPLCTFKSLEPVQELMKRESKFQSLAKEGGAM